MESQIARRKRALILVDVQRAFLNESNREVVGSIVEHLKRVPYEQYVLAEFHAEKGSLWDIQQGWICPRAEESTTSPEILEALKDRNLIIVEKETRSVFKGNKDVAAPLREAGIEEVHVVGLETHDCVLATCFEAFDLGFFVYAIEDCCESESRELHEAGLTLLRKQHMTDRFAIL